MIPEIKKILYATDLSESARYAFKYAADLAQRYDAMVTFLYVMEDMNQAVEFQIRGMLGGKEWDRVKSEKLDPYMHTLQSKSI